MVYDEVDGLWLRQWFMANLIAYD